MMRLFLQFELQKIQTYFKTKALAKIITSGLFLAVFAFVGTGLYFFFLSGFRFVNLSVEQEIQLPLTLFIYELFLLIMGGVVVISALASGIFNLFKGSYDAWIISSPSYRLFPRLILIKSILASSWPLFVMFLPAVLAFNNVYNLSALSLIVILTSVVLLLVLLNAISLLLILILGVIFHKLSKLTRFIQFSFGGLVWFILLIITAVATSVWKSASRVDLVKLFRADDADVLVNIHTIGSHFTLLPTHPLALEIIHFQDKATAPALGNFLILSLITAIMVTLWWKISYMFYPLWQKFQEGSTRTYPERGTPSHVHMTYHFRGGPVLALFKKEALVSSRNLKGVIWSMFLGGLWLAQVGTNIILSHNITRYQTDVSEKLAVFQALQFIVAIYFICSFALRFVFPSFSAEKKTSWILGTSPLNFTKIFFSKYLFFTVFFVLAGSIMSYINIQILNLPFTYGLYSMTLFISTVIFIVTLALSFGALFPSKETDDPEIISTSMSGLFFTAFSLIYGAVSAYTLYITITKDYLYPIVGFIGITLALVIIMLLSVPRSVSRRPL